MKTKYLLTAMALPLFAACTQEELPGVGTNDNAVALENRVKVGKVAFTEVEDEADTRLNYLTAQWEQGDKFGLFLMDGWNTGGNANGNGEQKNANLTKFMEQGVWNNMYTIRNYYQSNFPFKFNKANTAWENDDAIVEGNYFAVRPANNQQEHLSKLTNRRDAWLYINPVQKFKAANVDVNAPAKDHIAIGGLEENQFSLGYTQIYRDQELTEDEVLQLPINMRPILGAVDLAITNGDEFEFRLEKIVISRKDGSPMPTLAYVRPAGNTKENFGKREDDGESLYGQQINKMPGAEESNFVTRFPEAVKGDVSWADYTENAPAFAQPFIKDEYKDECGNSKEDYYWSIDSWTRSAARSVVEYSYPGQNGFTPYGCTGEQAKVAYEYVMDFTDENGVGVELKTKDYIRAFLVLPHSIYLREYNVIVYGQQKIPARGWSEGVILPDFKGMYVLPVEGTTSTENDGRFTLQNIDLSSEQSYIRADITFDDFRVGRARVVQTTNAADLLKHLKAYYGENGEADQNKNTLFYVRTMGTFEMSNDLVDYVQKLYNNYSITAGSKSLIYFTETTGDNGQGEIVFPADLKNDHAIDLFYYSKKVNLRNKGTQVIEKPIIYDYNESTRALYEALQESNWGKSILNDGVDILDKLEPVVADGLNGGVGSITNEGTLTIKTLIDTETTVSRQAVYNAENATLNLEGAALVGGTTKDKETFVHNNGKVNITNSYIQGTLENNGLVNVLKHKNASEVEHLWNAQTDCTQCGNKKAVVTVNEGATLKVTDGYNQAGIVNMTMTYYGIENYGVFIATNGFENRAITDGKGGWIKNGSKELAGATTGVEMSGLKNNGNVDNWCKLYVKNAGYIEQEDMYATIVLTGEANGMIENTVHGNITAAAGADTTSGDGKIAGQIIILTVDGEEVGGENGEMDIVKIQALLNEYHDYNKVILTGKKLYTSKPITEDGERGKVMLNFDYLEINKIDVDPKNEYVPGEVVFASKEILVQNPVDQSVIHLAVPKVTVDKGSIVRLAHSTTLRVGRSVPEISCQFEVNGLLEIQNGSAIQGMGTNDILKGTVNTWTENRDDQIKNFEVDSSESSNTSK